MSSMLKLVHSGRVASFSSSQQATWMARYVGTLVNRHITSKDIMISSSARVCGLMNSPRLEGVLHMGAGTIGMWG